ncbi:uncharacterized protein EI90DRAFT_3079286 [Cantharellus anzutake]|uniref:uncharacterized protein n=1 Tax=Cantharellus anzutake TaxID=1750568 RepID=UPI001903141B|nr:uncharacterized protein EI90DRAFT_3079286 [Cantharellus anzutake]KAF8321403.1 hypothetical protein EI90DRAFT_3079286 [Cantharellus anzutake]
MSEVQSPVPPPPVLKPTSSEETGIITHLRNVSGSKRFPLRVFKRLRPSPNVNSKAKERVNRKSPAEDPEVEDEYRLRDRIAARIQRLRHGSVDSQYEDDLGSEALVKFIDARQRPNDDVYDKDTYKWAILYENQRG